MDFLISITERSMAEKFIGLLREQGLAMVLCSLGRGTATDEVLDCLGLEASEKAVLCAMVTNTQLKPLIHDMTKRLWLDVPGNGIVMALPVNSVGGARTLEYLRHNHEETKAGERNVEQTGHELIIVITNHGYTDMVMDAAREAGASGGTAIHAKGTGTELAQKFFGVSIAAEKEMIFIVSTSARKKDIMRAIVHKAGMDTPACSIVFSAPLSAVAGLRTLDEE